MLKSSYFFLFQLPRFPELMLSINDFKVKRLCLCVCVRVCVCTRFALKAFKVICACWKCVCIAMNENPFVICIVNSQGIVIGLKKNG